LPPTSELSAMERFIQANQGKWNDVAERAASGVGLWENLPDGLYVALLSGAEVTESKSAGKLQIVLVWVIMEGDYEGETSRQFIGLESDKALQRVALLQNTLGYDPREYDVTQPGVLDAWLEELAEVELLCKIRLKTRGDYQNVYAEKLLSGEDDTVTEHNARMSAQTTGKPATNGGKGTATAPATAPTRQAAPPATAPAKETKRGEKPEPTPARQAAPARGAGAAPATPAAEELGEEDAELEIGSTVGFTLDDRELVGKVISINEAKGTASIKVGLKKYEVSFDDMELVDAA
jgi:hypothetical protein